ncbi:MAG: hypothetical protein IJT54_03330 [Candidatus Methanomethylophilaceae archaeon]|nr:hypothetical protein [Candidatus Methanomethylophilaceae archaeon]
MTLVITVKNVANGATVRMETEPEERIGEIIESAAEYWKKDPGAYVLKKGKTLLSASSTIDESGIIGNDILELIPDPEGGST